MAELERGGFYKDGHGDVHGPMTERVPGTWIDQHGAIYHPDGRQWSHTIDSAGNLIEAMTESTQIWRIFSEWQRSGEPASGLSQRLLAAQPTPSAESAPPIASPEGWHAPGMGEVHNEQHTKMIFCSDGEDLASDSLANEVCSALQQSPVTPPSESDRMDDLFNVIARLDAIGAILSHKRYEEFFNYYYANLTGSNPSQSAAPSESATIPEARFELTRSIIYKCPALKLPQEFLLRLGGVAQIVVLKGADDNTAEFILSACNAAMSREATGGKP